jgi:hypothetical protein
MTHAQSYIVLSNLCRLPFGLHIAITSYCMRVSLSIEITYIVSMHTEEYDVI